MTASGQFLCPPPGSYSAVSGQFLVAAVTDNSNISRAKLTGACVPRVLADRTIEHYPPRYPWQPLMPGAVDTARARGLEAIVRQRRL